MTAVRFWFSTHASQSSAESATTRTSIRPCWRPQNSAHWPVYTPGSSACIRMWFVLPGTTSCLPASSGIQKEWITT